MDYVQRLKVNRKTPIRELVFFGTGSSSGIPNIHCLTRSECRVCHSALDAHSPNRRRNTSLIVRFQHQGAANNSNTPNGFGKGPEEQLSLVTLLIDAGKTFYESAINWIPRHRLFVLDAVLLTHAHADAIQGLDDLRDWNFTSPLHEKGTQKRMHRSLPVHLNEDTFRGVQTAFPYLVDRNSATGGGQVACLDFNVFGALNGDLEFADYAPIDIATLAVQPLSVQHGTYNDSRPFVSLGYIFGNVLYISDVNFIPPNSWRTIEERTKRTIADEACPIEIVILDMLKEPEYASHFGFEKAIETVRRINPRYAFFVGISHHIDHFEMNARLFSLRDEGLQTHCQLAFDGLKLVLDTEE